MAFRLYVRQRTKGMPLFRMWVRVRRLDAALGFACLTPTGNIELRQTWSRQGATDQSGATGVPGAAAALGWRAAALQNTIDYS